MENGAGGSLKRKRQPEVACHSLDDLVSRLARQLDIMQPRADLQRSHQRLGMIQRAMLGTPRLAIISLKTFSRSNAIF